MIDLDFNLQSTIAEILSHIHKSRDFHDATAVDIKSVHTLPVKIAGFL